jgi:predicted acylesterase/phospholipase RssA/drug/metabolite transporter (DMT)-like permease
MRTTDGALVDAGTALDAFFQAVERQSMIRRLAVALLFVGPLFAAGQNADPCKDVLPHDLNLGLPRIASGEARVLEPALHRVFSALYAQRKAAGPCPKGIQINVAVGNDYQMLEWLDQKLIDAAIVSDLSLALLRRDEVRLYELDAFADRIDAVSARMLLPLSHATPMARVRDQKRGRWNERPDAAGEFQALLQEVWTAALTDPRKPESERRRTIRHVLLLGSHLSSSGFLAPIKDAITFFQSAASAQEQKDPRLDVDAIERDAWRFLFQSTRFTLDCATVEDCFVVALAGDHAKAKADEHRLPDGTTVVMFPGEELQRGAPIGEGVASREHLVITAAAAQRIFGVKGKDDLFAEPVANIPGVVALAMNDRNAPQDLLSTFNVETSFGARTHAFTVDETMQLLRQQRRRTSNREIALVLPGGGVKAAYQTRIVDELYGHRYLTNAALASSNDPSTLAVRNVIGTSGGALLGYFVSQLRDNPPDLFDILWLVDKRYLASTDVFGWTDLLRYVSIVFSFAIFCGVLFISSTRHVGDAGTGKFRARLTLAVMPLFLLAPVLIRAATGDIVENVPEIEGIFYAIMALLVMIADQWIVVRKEPRPTTPERERHLRRINAALAGAGVLLIAVPLLGDVAVDTHLPFIAAFVTMSLLLVSSALALARWFTRLRDPKRRLIEIAAAMAIVLLYCTFGTMPRVPHVVTGIFLFLLVGIQIWYTGSKPRQMQWLITLTAVFLVAMLCWPDDPGDNFLLAESLRVTTGTFFLSLGLIALIAAGALWGYRGQYYDVEGFKEVGMAFIVLLVYSLATLVTMMALTTLLPEFVTPLELTGKFWRVLAAVSFILSAMILGLSRHPRFASRAWARAVLFLRKSHPNGLTLHRRYARILFLAVLSVTWWNVVAAPALYGNRQAGEYHRNAIRKFTSRNGAFAPTARFVTPANLLQQDGTRYFMFLAGDEKDCPSFSRRPTTGAQWWIYATAAATSDSRCRPVKDAAALAQSVSFASGSPFPIFPAHRVTQAPDNAPYIDGGYSNNVPVDAARTLDASEVLIIDSSNPLAAPRAAETWMDFARQKTLGHLVVNLGRLPQYLFEHSQQVDRISRADLFVVALAPSRYEKGWPPLFDFRSSVVQRMRKTANSDLQHRIGMVESWGQPAFSFNVHLPPS